MSDGCMIERIMVKAGDIVWVRVVFPNKWQPGVVLACNKLGIKVSFSFSLNDGVSASATYFLESEVLPFHQGFPSLVTSNPHSPFLHSALRFFGQSLLSALRCPCLLGHTQAQLPPNGSRSVAHFDPVPLFGFVLDAAVSPWVQPPRFAHAVRLVAQLHAFRTYSSMQHKKIYQQTHNTVYNVKLLPSSSLGQKMHSITQESVPLEHSEKCQIISKYGEKNIATGAISRLNSTVLVREGNSKHLFKNKLLLISQKLKHSPSLDPLYMVQASLKSERQSLLGFKSISDQGILDICFGNSSTMSETHISVPSNFKIDLRNYINKREDNALELCCRLPDAETIVYLNRKRRRLDKSDSFHVFPQIAGVQESQKDAYFSKHTRPRILDIKLLEPEGNIQKDHQASGCFCETTKNFTDEVQKVDSKRSPNCKSLSNLQLCFHSDKFDASAVKAKDMLGTDSSVYKERLQMSCNSNTSPLKSKRSARTALSSGDCLVEGKDCYEGIASCSIFNSEVGQPSKTHVPFSPTSLFMKFPRNFKLPSNEQLIKKFCVFGSVDSSRTRVFCYTGSAQVAFLQEIDAVAAYQYVKRKAWFGAANVRFWLDPFEHKRRGFKCSALVPPSASKQIGPPLKSCLRNSNSWRQENRKKHCRVRYAAPSVSKQIGLPLKSCLKNSNSLRQESRKKHRRVRFTIET